MHFFEETFFRGAQKKDDLQFFFIRNTSHRYIVRDLTLETKETPVSIFYRKAIYFYVTQCIFQCTITAILYIPILKEAHKLIGLKIYHY